MAQYKGSSRQHEINVARRRRDTRRFGQKFTEFFDSGEVILGIFLLPIMALLLLKLPLGGELTLILAWLYARRFVNVSNRYFDFPYRVPKIANVGDGSFAPRRNKKGKIEYVKGSGIAYIGTDVETKEEIYAGDSDLRTHQLVLGTTGSGKTEYLLGLVANALVQNTGCIYCDGKGDPKLQKEVFRLARYFGREDDLLIINFITSGRDFVEKQPDKVTNNMNLMANTSSGMLIELIVSMMDDSGGGGDMWKGRAISFVAALTRPLTYLRDKGYINLSPEKFLEYFELNVIEEMVWEHKGKYGDMFDVIVAPLRSYLTTLPGYLKNKIKKQETKTLEQHGYIIMQLTRIFNDLNFNYGHIFKTRVGDVDFFDVVINRRILTVLLPALERAPDSLRMLGKLIVGSIKQMMAGCLGNRVEGVVREIIDSRPTNAPVPFYCILDEYGYYAVIGFAVAPAQARSLGFSVIFAAQDFSSLKKSSAEEADATWENTNIRAVGRITSGQKSETWERIQGAAGESTEAVLSGYERKSGAVNEWFKQNDNINFDRRNRIEYDDLAMQQDGEFTFLIGKKEKGGRSGGVRVIRGMGFYTAGPTPKEMRINDLIPVEAPEPGELPKQRLAMDAIVAAIVDGTFCNAVQQTIAGNKLIFGLHRILESNATAPGRKTPLSETDAAFAALGWVITDQPLDALLRPATVVQPVTTPATSNDAPATVHGSTESYIAPPDAAPVIERIALQDKVFSLVDQVLAGQLRLPGQDDIEMHDVHIPPSISGTSLLRASSTDEIDFADQVEPILKRFSFLVDEEYEDDHDWLDSVKVAEHTQLLHAEELAMGKPFASMEAKFAVESRIEALRRNLDSGTEYPQPPEPEPISLDEAQARVAMLAERCRQIVKTSVTDDDAK